MSRKTILSILKGASYIGIYGGLLMPLVFLPIVIFPFVFSKLIFFQVLVGITFPLYLGLAWMEPSHRPGKHLLYGAISAYFLAIFLSVLFAIDPARAWWGNQERMNGFFTILHFLAWLTMAIGMIKTWRQWERLLKYEVVLSGVMACVSLLEIPFPKLLLFPAGPRIGGLLDNPIYMGAYQIFNLFFLALLWTRTTSKTARIWYAVLAVLDLIAFFLAQSRGSLLGLVAGVAAFAFFYALVGKNRKASKAIFVALVGGLVGYGLLFFFRNTPLIHSSPFYRLTDFTVSVTRLIAWKIAWQGFLHRPLFGWGFDNFHILFNQNYNPESLRFGNYETWFDRSHNTILDVFSMTGIVGFLTYLGVNISIYVALWKAYKKRYLDGIRFAILAALPVGYFVQNLFVFDHPAAFSMSFLMYALIIGVTRPEIIGEKEVSATEPKVRAVPWTGLVLVELVGLLVVWRLSVLPFRVSEISIDSNNAFQRGQVDLAYSYAAQAREIWTPYLDEQVFLLTRNVVALSQAGQLKTYAKKAELIKLTKDILDEELVRHPMNTNTIYLAARLSQELMSMDPAEVARAERYYRQAIDSSPKRQQMWYSLADLYYRTGRQPQALQIEKDMRDLDPLGGQGHWVYGISLYYRKGDRDAGAKEIIESQTAQYRYELSAQELVPLTEAAIYAKDEAALRRMVDMYGNIERSDYVQVYGQLYKTLMDAKLTAIADYLLEHVPANVRSQVVNRIQIDSAPTQVLQAQ